MGVDGTTRPPLPVPICFHKQRPNHGTPAAFPMSILIDYWFLDASLESSHNAEFLLNAVSDLGTAPAIVQECNQIAGHGILLKSRLE